MSWFEKLMPSRIRTEGGVKRAIPEGLWSKCTACSAVLYRAELERNQDVCPKCNYHMRVYVAGVWIYFLTSLRAKKSPVSICRSTGSGSKTARNTRIV